MAEAISAPAARRSARVRDRAGHTNRWRVPLASNARRTADAYFGTAAWKARASPVTCLGLRNAHFWPGWNAVRLNQRNCGRTEIAHTDTLQLRAFRRLPGGPAGADRARRASRNFLRGIFHGRQFGIEDGGRACSLRALRALRGSCGGVPLYRLGVMRWTRSALPGKFHLSAAFCRANSKERMRRKAKLFPGKFDLGPMDHVRTLREFDDVITATYCGFRDASDYYARSSALRVIGEIQVPAFILTAQDDPFVPFASFSRSLR